MLRIAKGLGVPLQALSAAALPLPLWFRDTFYDQVADNRWTPAAWAQSHSVMSCPASAVTLCVSRRYRLLGKKDRCRCVHAEALVQRVLFASLLRRLAATLRCAAQVVRRAL